MPRSQNPRVSHKNLKYSRMYTALEIQLWNEGKCKTKRGPRWGKTTGGTDPVNPVGISFHVRLRVHETETTPQSHRLIVLTQKQALPPPWARQSSPPTAISLLLGKIGPPGHPSLSRATWNTWPHDEQPPLLATWNTWPHASHPVYDHMERHAATPSMCSKLGAAHPNTALRNTLRVTLTEPTVAS